MSNNTRTRNLLPHLAKTTGLITVLALSLTARAQPLVDCSKAEFKSINTARSLFLWTDGAEEKIRKAKAQGTHEVKRHSTLGPGTPPGYCKTIISKRGAAYCKEPGHPQYKKALASIIRVCREAAVAPKPAKSGAAVDCKDKRFKRAGASVDQLLSWVEMGLRDVDRLAKHEQFRLKPKCDMALGYAGAAYCKAPGNPKTAAAVAFVHKKCGGTRDKVAGENAAEAAAQKASVAQAKANRKIVSYPRSTYRGAGNKALAAAMKRALLKNRVAKSKAEILRVRPMGSWQAGRYSDTKVPYKKIMGTVLWHDKDNDGVCRFVSYKFVKERKRGGKWSPLRFKAFCLSCPEGWTKCK